MISPITNKHSTKFLKKFDTTHIIKRWHDEFNIDIKSEFGVSIKVIELFQCLDSGLMFFEPQVTGSPSLYEKLDNTFSWYYLDQKWEYQIAIKELKRNKNILEIGCGNGAFLERFSEKTPGINVVGLDTNSEAVREASEKGLAVFNESIVEFSNNYPDFKIDAIVAFQVLEHVSDPIPFLKDLIRHLPIAGKLILCVPNQDCFYKYSDELLDMPPHHITKWSIKSFKFLEKILPLKLNKIEIEPLFEMHKNRWHFLTSQYFRKNRWYGRLLFNRLTNSIISKLLESKNVRRYIKGHTLYVSFEKIDL